VSTIQFTQACCCPV